MMRGEGPMDLAYSHPIRIRAGGTAVQRPEQSRVPWRLIGLAAVVTSGAALAALPKPPSFPSDEQRQWHALGIAPLSAGGVTGLRMEASEAVRPIEIAPQRETPFVIARPVEPKPVEKGPIRIRGRVGDGLYWSLRSAGASPQVAAQFLAALATEVDVGDDIQPGDGFDLVLGGSSDGALLYAGLSRLAASDLQLVRWTANGRSNWIDAANADKPAPVSSGLILPAAGHITSYFGNRVHPILRFTRFHAGLDIGASWGSPIVAAGDGQVVGAGWAGGYGRQVRIAHTGGLASSYSHMSSLAVAPGSFVRKGQVIGYVGSSGFSTGPHVHFEVRRGGVPVNPLSVRIESAPLVDPQLADAIKARLKALLSIGAKHA